jgi:YcxB-like protein
LEFSDEGIRFESPIGNVLMPWDYFIKWRRGRHLILMFSGRRFFHMLPRHFFADDATFEKAATMIENKLGAAT